MKKFFFLLSLAVLASSCSVGRYMPNAVNNFGIQTQVVLDRANFRIVRDVEVVEEINNSNLKRVDVERSAYGKLLRQNPLSGSQAFINVAVEEIDRENSNLLRTLFGGRPEHKQYVSIRATIIEFVNENGQPVASTSSPYQASAQSIQPSVQFAAAPTVQSTEQKTEVKKETSKKAVKKEASKKETKTEKAESKPVTTEPVAVPVLAIEEDNSPLASEERRKHGENLISQSTQYLEKKNADKVLVETYQELVRRYREKPTKNAVDRISMVHQFIFIGKYNKTLKAMKKESDENQRIAILLNAAEEAMKE